MTIMAERARDSAVCYSQISTTQQEDGIKLLNRLSPEKGSQILDLGCGTGYLANLLAKRVGPVGKVVAVDPDGERIKLAKETYSETCSNLEFLQRSDKDFPEGQYDVIFASSVIHWIEDKQTTFKRVYENLKPGGRFGFTAEDHVDSRFMLYMKKLFGSVEAAEAKLGKIHVVPAVEYEQLATSNGFEVTAIDFCQRTTTWSPDSFLNWVFGVLQGKFDHLAMDREAVENFKKYYASEDNPLELDIPRLTIILTKPFHSCT